MGDAWNNWAKTDDETGSTTKKEQNGKPLDNKQLWDIANASPAIQIHRSALQQPPKTAFKPEIRILKRPTTSSNTPSTLSTNASTTSLAEREKAYIEARRKIFGETESKSGSASPVVKSGKVEEPKNAPSRQPKGPEDNSVSSKGFHNGPKRPKA